MVALLEKTIFHPKTTFFKNSEKQCGQLCYLLNKLSYVSANKVITDGKDNMKHIYTLESFMFVFAKQYFLNP